MIMTLEQDKDAFLKLAKKKGFEIYPFVANVSTPFMWPDGNDFGGFLEIAEKLGVKLLYQSVDEDDGKLSGLFFGFSYNGIFHLYQKMADWWVEKEQKSMAADLSKPDFLENTSEKLAEELYAFMMKIYGNVDDCQNFSMKGFTQFWRKNGIEPYGDLTPEKEAKVSKVDSMVIDRFIQERMEAQKKLVPQIADKYMEWHKQNGLGKFTLANLRSFCKEGNYDLSPDVRDVFLKKEIEKRFLEKQGTLK